MIILMFADLFNRLLQNFSNHHRYSRNTFIYSVRDKLGMKLKKVIYKCPPRFSLRFYPLKFLFKFLIAITISLKERIDYTYNFFLYPNDFLALLLSKIFRKKVSDSLIDCERVKYPYFRLNFDVSLLNNFYLIKFPYH